MSSSYESRGLAYLLPPKSAITRENVQFTTLAGQYTTPTSSDPASSSSLYNIASSHTHGTALSSSHSGGMMVLDGNATPTLTNSSHVYMRREFPAETYVRVKRQVNQMMEHPYEKTFKHRVENVLEYNRRLIVRAKWKMLIQWRYFWMPVRRRLEGWWGLSMVILEDVKNMCLFALHELRSDCSMMVGQLYAFAY